VEAVGRSATTTSPVDVEQDDHLQDDLLRLIVTACHPVLTPEARVALTLRCLGGLNTEDIARARRFLREVDSSSVMVNASTRFADGFEYGLGAEIGISTDKLHARGPVGLEGLTSLKFVVLGDGHIRT